MQEDLEKLRYPIGKFIAPELIYFDEIKKLIAELEALPAKVRKAVSGLNDSQLDTPYRPGGWTLRQVVHHLPDSHMNAYIRFKLAITQETPTILPYMEDRWAELEEAKHAPVGMSLDLLESLHKRWTMFLQNMSEADFQRTYIHPEHQKTFRLDIVLALYAWHGEHHLQHILVTRGANGW
ncbi:MAG: putative metal-dependent hydrolase [Sphingobacteriaceae bacterium]|jgi:hypothetical protein|nr:putative metal-dependent hydrolase [Sphingobacteriaceae bacterium]